MKGTVSKTQKRIGWALLLGLPVLALIRFEPEPSSSTPDSEWIREEAYRVCVELGRRHPQNSSFSAESCREEADRLVLDP